MSLDRMGNSPRANKIEKNLDGPHKNSEQQFSDTSRESEKVSGHSQNSRSQHGRRNSSKRNSYQEQSPPGTYSAIDLGTNNCRLLIAKPTQKGFRVVDAFSRIVRLGEGIAQNGVMSEEAIDRTIEALKVCADKISRRNVIGMRHVATQACRVAGNSDEFVERVRQETGLTLDIITSAEEAKLAVMGCQSLIAHHNRNALIFDIGGGSTELIWVSSKGRRTEIMGWTSIPWGVVNLAETFSHPGDSVSPEIYSKMLKSVEEYLIPFENQYKIRDMCKRKNTQFLGTSGTVTTLASYHLDLEVYDRSKVDGLWMKTAEAIKISKDVADMSYDERCAMKSIGSERADLVVAGCAILDALLNMWNVKSLRVADRGIREGILRGLMKKDRVPMTAPGLIME